MNLVAVKTRVVCVSHAAGAAGDEVARIVATRLGFRYLDEEIVGRAAAKDNLARDAVADVERRRPWAVRFLQQLGEGGGAAADLGLYVPTADSLVSSEGLRELIREVIREAAEEGQIVIASHAASLALAERTDALRVLVTASPATRSARIAAARGLPERQAAAVVKEEDASRADYLKRFYGVDRELPTHYDLVVNTDALSPETAAGIVVHAAG